MASKPMKYAINPRHVEALREAKAKNPKVYDEMVKEAQSALKMRGALSKASKFEQDMLNAASLGTKRTAKAPKSVPSPAKVAATEAKGAALAKQLGSQEGKSFFNKTVYLLQTPKGRAALPALLIAAGLGMSGSKRK